MASILNREAYYVYFFEEDVQFRKEGTLYGDVLSHLDYGVPSNDPRRHPWGTNEMVSIP